MAVALFVELKARAGKEEEVARFLSGAQGLVEQEPATLAWFAIRIDADTFAIFDTFADESGRQAHLSGQVAAALMGKADELLSAPPIIRRVDVLAEKLPR